MKRFFKKIFIAIKNTILDAFDFSKDLTKKTGIGLKENLKHDAEELSKKGIVDKVNDFYGYVRAWVISSYNRRIDKKIEKELRTKFRPAVKRLAIKARECGYKDLKDAMHDISYQMDI